MKRILLAAGLCLLAAPAAAQTRMGAFTFHDEKDPITDENSSYIYTEEAEGGFMPATLLYKCEDGEVLTLLKGNGFYMDDELQVTWRFDQQEPQTASWRVAEVQWLIPPMENQETFRTSALTASRLAIRVRESDGGSRTYLFNLNGFTRGFQAMGCGTAGE
jgi:hypothetical protein